MVQKGRRSHECLTRGVAGTLQTSQGEKPTAIKGRDLFTNLKKKRSQMHHRIAKRKEDETTGGNRKPHQVKSFGVGQRKKFARFID